MENRNCLPFPASGRCAMGVSKKFCKAEYDNLTTWIVGHCNQAVLTQFPKWDDVRLWSSCIVGTLDYNVMDCVPGGTALVSETRIWNEGYSNWWMLSNISHLPTPILCRANVGVWRLSPELSAEIERAYQGQTSL